jgi:hypothetical protein
VISLRWEGYIRRPPSRRGNSGKLAASAALLNEIGERCPNLRELHIIHAHLDSVTLRDFPPSLEFLGFEGCVVSLDFFGPLQDASVLANLKGMDLNYVHNLSSHSRHSIPGILSRRLEIRNLQLKHCFKISDEDLIRIPLRLTNLETLNVSDLT